MKENQSSRKKFLQQIGALGVASAAFPLSSLAAQQKSEERIMLYEKRVSVGEKLD
jgi:hypothetical protein